MEKRNKVILIGTIIVTITVVILCIYILNKNEDNLIVDSKKFINEYTSLNDTQIDSSDSTYESVTIDENNTIRYLDISDAITMLEDGTGVIYFGYSSCPWCRSIVEVLTNVGIELNEIIYYVDIEDIRSEFVIENEDAKEVKHGSEEYYKILELLDKSLVDYYLDDGHNNEYYAGEKRLYAPTVVALKDGVVTDIHTGTLDSQEKENVGLTEDEEKELTKTFKNLINSIESDNVCTSETC